MKPKIRAPYFEIGTKNYIYGDKVLEYAIAADKAAEKYDIDVLFICPAVEIRQVVQNTKHLIVLAPYMDTLRPGRGMADVLPEGLKAAGAQGVVINHCEKPMSLPQMKATIDRARELDFLVFACADTLDEAKAIANLHPDIINPEPSEIIGGGNGVSPMAYVKDSIAVIKATVAIETVAAVDKKIKTKTFFVRSLTADAETLLTQAESEEIKAACKKVYEAVRYADPMSDDALAACESQITLKFAELSEAVHRGDAEAVAKAARETVILVTDRNNKCKLLK